MVSLGHSAQCWAHSHPLTSSCELQPQGFASGVFPGGLVVRIPGFHWDAARCVQMNFLARLPGNGRMEKVELEEIADSFCGGVARGG